MKRAEGTTTDVTGEQLQPLTAEWLKANTEIDGWLAFFVFCLVVSGLAGVIYPILTYNAADYFGSVLLGMRYYFGWWWQSFVAILVVVLLFRRSPAAIFWAKYLMILSLLYCGLGLWLEGGDLGQAIGGVVDDFKIVLKGKGNVPSRIARYILGVGVYIDDESRLAVRGIVLSLIGFLYLTFSKRVQIVIPKSYRRVGVRAWICAILLPLLGLVLTCVGIANIDSCYHNYVEVQQSELSAGELTDGHVVFGRIEGWSFGVERNDNGVNVCSLINDDESCILLQSALWYDDSVECFDRIVEVSDLEKQGRQVVRDDKDVGNGVTRYYRVVRYDLDDDLIFQHIACLFDRESAKVALVVGHFHEKEVPDFERVLNTVRFKK